MSVGDWVVVVLAVMGAVGVLLMFILNIFLGSIRANQSEIKNNQANIWNWAKGAVADLKQDYARDIEKLHLEVMDLRRHMRHAERALYSELMELAKQCPGGEKIVESIKKTLRESPI